MAITTPAPSSPAKASRRVRHAIAIKSLAALLALIAALSAWTLALGLPLAGAWGVVTLLAGWFAMVVFMRLAHQVVARRHGMRTEAQQGRTLERILSRHGCTVRRDVPVHGVGDIDVLVTCPGRPGFFRSRKQEGWIVEIKSFRSWDVHGHHGPRERDALAQMGQQMRATGIPRAILWLPDAPDDHGTIKMVTGVRVIQGPARNVVRGIVF